VFCGRFGLCDDDKGCERFLGRFGLCMLALSPLFMFAVVDKRCGFGVLEWKRKSKHCFPAREVL
jgi:hypothetical protein